MFSCVHKRFVLTYNVCMSWLTTSIVCVYFHCTITTTGCLLPLRKGMYMDVCLPVYTCVCIPSNKHWLLLITCIFFNWASQVALVVKNLSANAEDVRDAGLIPVGREDSWRRAWQPTPVLLPGESHGQRSLAGYSPWGHKESCVCVCMYPIK